ncbi:hypothetical protein [Burkholderia gladioli]|uniref:hypothetical protein n=2 Tax=Burkholderia gladioli TaxID=28095 RepID=UPI000F52DDD8|nr:hypothetical protein [Burkholderia gladioli]MBU9273046.1 hypothetical protein [Burkholderia gladioli]
MKDIRKRPHRAAPGLVPVELLGMKGACPICKTETEIPWLAKMEFPKQPIKSDHGQGHWVPVDIPLTCSSDVCRHNFSIKAPILPDKNRWALYGDEAARYISHPPAEHSSEPLNFYCVTLVALHKRRHDRVRRQIFNLKKSIRPTEDPDSWVHHFTEIWESRPKSGTFLLKNKLAKIEHTRKLAKIIRDARPELTTFNISGCIIVPGDPKERKKLLKYQKDNAFSESILTTLREFRNREKSVNWIFDNIQDTTSGSKTEGWASECFLGLQYTRLFCWISAGATVIEPSFVRPGSHFLLEVADFISYCVARDFERAIIGQPPEFPSSLLGQGFYQGTLGNGNVEHMWNVGLPLKKFYGLEVARS